MLWHQHSSKLFLPAHSYRNDTRLGTWASCTPQFFRTPPTTAPTVPQRAQSTWRSSWDPSHLRLADWKSHRQTYIHMATVSKASSCLFLIGFTHSTLACIHNASWLVLNAQLWSTWRGDYCTLLCLVHCCAVLCWSDKVVVVVLNASTVVLYVVLSACYFFFFLLCCDPSIDRLSIFYA